jgi:DNA-binding NtrC family response regulator
MPQLDTRLSDARGLLGRRRFAFTLKPPLGPPLRVRMSTSRYVVGRGADCDLQLPDPERRLSRRHFTLEHRAAGLRVSDLSRNGCFLDGERLGAEARPFRPGQRLEFAGFTLIADNPQVAGPDRTTLSGAVRDPLDLGLVGTSSCIGQLRQDILRCGAFDLPVLIQGETGSGKELVARGLHEASHFAQGPLVAVNCGAIPEGTAASELFGHEKGAFTGASEARLGAFRRAQGGTLFLDELGELSPAVQASLLRAVETREVLPLGAEKPVPVHFRLVAATHRDLRGAVRRGDFREDLYYRINVIALEIPPLRQRPGDVPLLVLHFAREAAGGRNVKFSDDALDALAGCSWPGNVRQLRNVVLRAMVCAGGSEVSRCHLDLRDADREVRRRAAYPGAGGSQDVADRAVVVAHEDVRPYGASVAPDSLPEFSAVALPPARLNAQQGFAEIIAVLGRNGGNRSRAARELGISRSTLYARISRFSEASGVS